LNGLNTYLGPTRLNSGVLSVNSITDGGLSSGIGMSSSNRDNLVFAGGALRYTGPSTRTDRGFNYAINTNYYHFDVSQPDTLLTFGTIGNARFDGNNTTIMKTGPGTLVFGKGPGATYNFPVKSIFLMEGTFLTESGNVVQHNLHCIASQGPALVLGDGAVMGFNNPMENYVDGGEMMVQYVGTQSCARVTAGTWLLCGPSSTNAAGVLQYNTHIFDINDGADDVDLDLKGTLGIYKSDANSYLRKTGAGTLRFNSSSSTFRGTTIIRNGRVLVAANVPKGGNSVLGNCTNDVVIGDADTQAGDVPTFVFEGTASRTFARGIVVGPCPGNPTVGCISNINATFSGPLTLNSTLQVFSVSDGANAVTVSGVASGDGGLTKTGSGVAVLTAANSYTGTTTVAEGTLRLGAAERIADTSGLRLSGGTFDPAGFNQTMGPLDVDAAAALDFGDAAMTLTFADSSAESWDGTLLLRHWKNGVSHLFVGDSASLTEAQLAKIMSPSGQIATQRSDGEVILLPLGTLIQIR